MVYGGMIGGNSYNFEDEDGGFLGMVDSMEDEEEEERVTNGPNDGSSSSSAPSSPNKDKVAVQERATMTWRLNKSGKKSESADEMDDCVYFLTLSDKGDKWEWSKPDTKLGEKGPVPTNTEGLVSLGSPSLSPSLSSSMGNKGVGKGTRPSARTEHGMAKVDTNLVALFGGWTNSTYTRICADIHVQEAIHFYFYFTSILLLFYFYIVLLYPLLIPIHSHQMRKQTSALCPSTIIILTLILTPSFINSPPITPTLTPSSPNFHLSSLTQPLAPLTSSGL
jgi:hypothetical protein